MDRKFINLSSRSKLYEWTSSCYQVLQFHSCSLRKRDLPILRLKNNASIIQLDDATVKQQIFVCFCNLFIQYPLFCLLCVLCSTFGGSMMVNFFTYRKPILSGLLTPRPVAITVAAWWLIFYCPMNAFEKICSMKPVLLIMVILKE